MHRFYLPPDRCADRTLVLTGAEAHHGLHVVRLRPSEQVAVLDGAGHEYLCEVREMKRDIIRLAVRQKNVIPPSRCPITLVQAIPKGKGFEAIVQRATELGVRRIVPLWAERVVVHVERERLEHKLDKWRAVAVESIKQCGWAWLPDIETPLTPQALLARHDTFDLSLVASLQAGRRHPREWFRKFQADHGRLPQSVAVWVGPEGDFTPSELDAIRAGGALPISLGPVVLRSETAAVYCLAVLNYELQAETL
ncbi:MAG: 16S rRNA (uracil(1498)-N(3))-methyltransferase [Verrucomicrobia bacterium]|nr:16S rRNA (uracil(1498)-N(3))-methyltransferase [Verrucomicrobiota bacterium]